MITVWKATQYKRKKVFVMKKFIALGIALMVLLFSFIPSAEVADANTGIQMCSDIKPPKEPYDIKG